MMIHQGFIINLEMNHAVKKLWPQINETTKLVREHIKGDYVIMVYPMLSTKIEYKFYYDKQADILYLER